MAISHDRTRHRRASTPRVACRIAVNASFSPRTDGASACAREEPKCGNIETAPRRSTTSRTCDHAHHGSECNPAKAEQTRTIHCYCYEGCGSKTQTQEDIARAMCLSQTFLLGGKAVFPGSWFYSPARHTVPLDPLRDGRNFPKRVICVADACGMIWAGSGFFVASRTPGTGRDSREDHSRILDMRLDRIAGVVPAASSRCMGLLRTARPAASSGRGEPIR